MIEKKSERTVIDKSDSGRAGTSVVRKFKPIIDEEIPWAEIIPYKPERVRKSDRNSASKPVGDDIALPADYFASSFEDTVPRAKILEVYSAAGSGLDMAPFPFLIGSVLLALIYCLMSAQ